MKRLPQDFDATKFQHLIKTIYIKGGNVNWYQYGLNCRLVYGDNSSKVQSLWDEETLCVELGGVTSQDYDAFWEGYWYGLEQYLSVPETTSE